MVITCKKPCKKKRSTMLTVEQMADIALGTPEIGAVNFNVLHALIHVIIQQLNIQKCLVEFKGYDSDRMEGIILTAKPGPILKLSEYMIDTGEGKPCPPKGKDEDEAEKDGGRKPPCECMGKKKKTDEDKDKEKEKDKDKEKEKDREKSKEKEKTEKSKDEFDAENKKKQEKRIEKKDEECEEVDEPEPKKVRELNLPKKSCPCKAQETVPILDDDVRAAASSYYGSDTEGNCQTIVRVEPVGERCDSWRSRPALAHESMVKLEEKVAMLQDAFEALEQMPTNEELKKKTTQNPGCQTTPVKDLWQMFNLNKRVESCEGAIEKLASMIEDLVKETCNFKEAMMVIADAVDDMECADQSAKTTCCAALQGSTGNPFSPPGSKGQKTNVTFTTQIVENAPPMGKCAGGPCLEDKDKSSPAAKPPDSGGAEAALEGGESSEAKPDAGEEGAEGAEPSSQTLDDDSLKGPQVGIGPEFYKMSAAQKFCVLKENINCLICQFRNMSEALPVNQIASKLCALVSMQRQLDALEKEWRAFIESFGPGGIMGLHNSIETIKSDIDNLNGLISRLIAEKQDMELTIRNILHEIEHLKKVKADFEIVEDLLAEKADASVVNRKVSHDQFDAACDDLTRGLDETLERLMQQESMWNEAMNELQKDVDNKLDKNEIMPLKEFINKKLKCLQEKLRQLAQLRKDAEAAGAKSRILRNLNCIACDGDVVMKMDNMSSFQCPSLQPSKNIKPMLTFELDQVRKAMKKGPCRAVNHVEEAITDAQKKMAGIPLTQRDAVDSKIPKLAHFCNRYCGGSHTITTPQQRVTRIGHFLTEFGPQAMAMFNQEAYDAKCAPPMTAAEQELQKPCV